jgi:hypothetical protein
MGSLFLMIIGINSFILFNRKASTPYLYVAAIVSTLLIGFSSEIRNEVSIVIVSLMLIYLFASTIQWRHKISLLAIIISLFILSKKSIQSYFDYKFDEATELVEQSAGHVYTGERISGHKFWHPVFCGLGDFDTKYG